MLSDIEKHKLFQTWEAKARELWEAGYERREYRNPCVPATFHRNGEVVYLLLDEQSKEWQIKPLDLTEPTMF